MVVVIVMVVGGGGGGDDYHDHAGGTLHRLERNTAAVWHEAGDSNSKTQVTRYNVADRKPSADAFAL